MFSPTLCWVALAIGRWLEHALESVAEPSCGNALRQCRLAHMPARRLARQMLSCRDSATSNSAFSYAMASVSTPELTDILFGTTDIRHVFSRGCCSAHGRTWPLD